MMMRSREATYTEESGTIMDLTYPAVSEKHKITVKMIRSDLAKVILGIEEFLKKDRAKRKRRNNRPPRGWSAAAYAVYLADLDELRSNLEEAFKVSHKHKDDK